MDEKQAKQTIDQLTELVLYHSRRYYDKMRRRLKIMNTTNCCIG